MDLRKTLFGFGENKSNLGKARAQKLLSQGIRDNGKVYAYSEYWYNKLLRGDTPEKIENYQYYKRDGELTAPKTVYRLYDSGKEYYLEINKTVYDYCCHILNNDFLNESVAEAFIQNEQEYNLEQDKLAEQNELEEQKAIEDAEQKELVWKVWLSQQIKDYKDFHVASTVENIYLKKGILESKYISRKVLVLIENIKIDRCRNELKDLLHNGNPASKKVFSFMTGIKLPNTEKGTRLAIDEYAKNK